MCQQDPDQDEDEESPEEMAEYDSILISSAGDVVAGLANALGQDFSQAFPTFFNLISRYYVSLIVVAIHAKSDSCAEKAALVERAFLCYRCSL